jgi:ankyrin repeat protein
LVDQTAFNLRSEINQVNEKTSARNNVKSFSNESKKIKSLKFKICGIKPNGLSIRRLLLKEHKFSRMFSAGQLIKYKDILLLNKYIKPEYGIYDLKPSLLLAAKKPNVEIVRLLIDSGADINIQGALKELPSKTPFEKLLLSYINKLGDYTNTPLIESCSRGNLKVAQLLLDNGADINAKKRNTGETALMEATSIDHKEIVELLLDHGADINDKDDHGDTTLFYASSQASIEIVKLLIDRGADVYAKNNRDETALMKASCNFSDDLQIAQLLLDCGVDINAKDNNGKTAVKEAENNRRFELVKFLLAKGAKSDSS